MSISNLFYPNGYNVEANQILLSNNASSNNPLPYQISRNYNLTATVTGPYTSAQSITCNVTVRDNFVMVRVPELLAVSSVTLSVITLTFSAALPTPITNVTQSIIAYSTSTHNNYEDNAFSVLNLNGLTLLITLLPGPLGTNTYFGTTGFRSFNLVYNTLTPIPFQPHP